MSLDFPALIVALKRILSLSVYLQSVSPLLRSPRKSNLQHVCIDLKNKKTHSCCVIGPVTNGKTQRHLARSSVTMEIEANLIAPCFTLQEREANLILIYSAAPMSARQLDYPSPRFV